MKIMIYETEEVSDTQRVQIADVIDKEVSKRAATREEMKKFIWECGETWPIQLEAAHRSVSAGFKDPVVELELDLDEDDEDLL